MKKTRRVVDGRAENLFCRILLHYLTGFQAAGADLDPFGPAVNPGVDGL